MRGKVKRGRDEVIIVNSGRGLAREVTRAGTGGKGETGMREVNSRQQGCRAETCRRAEVELGRDEGVWEGETGD